MLLTYLPIAAAAERLSATLPAADTRARGQAAQMRGMADSLLTPGNMMFPGPGMTMDDLILVLMR